MQAYDAAALLSQRDAVHRDDDNKCYLVDHHLLEILRTDNGPKNWEKLGKTSVTLGKRAEERAASRIEIQAGYVFVCCGDRIQEYSSSLRCTPLRSFLLFSLLALHARGGAGMEGGVGLWCEVGQRAGARRD